MEQSLLILIFVSLVVLIFRTTRKKEDAGSLDLLLQQMNELGRTVDERMNTSQKEVRESLVTQFGESQKLVKDINEQVNKQLLNVAREMTQANEASKQAFSVMDQLKDLEKVLKHQKQRGNLGEASLELILSNMLPPDAYKTQYNFSNGSMVDAVIVTKDGLIPVDAKFSLDNYNRLVHEEDPERKKELEKEFKNDLKKRIDETAKYILPKEDTLPFAFMFIPAEAIYYDLLVNEVGSVKVNTRSLIDYAYNDKNVIVVSPTTFSAYLQSVLYGFKAFKIEESAKEIGKQVESLNRHLKAYEEYHGKLGKSLNTVVNHYMATNKEFKKIDKDVMRITGEGVNLELPEVDKVSEE
jgi:DNA recombination protein RmuC